MQVFSVVSHYNGQPDSDKLQRAKQVNQCLAVLNPDMLHLGGGLLFRGWDAMHQHRYSQIMFLGVHDLQPRWPNHVLEWSRILLKPIGLKNLGLVTLSIAIFEHLNFTGICEVHKEQQIVNKQLKTAISYQ